jgi:hypothetical protein
MNPIPITTLTAGAVQQDLQSDGVNSLGLTTLSLSTRWANATPAAGDYNPTSLTLNIAALRAPFRGIREFTYAAAVSALAGNLTESATSLSVIAGQGARFPSPPAGQNVLLTLSNASGSKLEVVSLTARTDDILMIDRAALGSAKQSFSTGDRVALRLLPGTRTSQFIGADGVSLAGGCTVLRLHPQAILRLRTLAVQRYAAAGQPQLFPVPWVMVLRGVEGFGTAKWFEPDEDMTAGGLISFHDGRGLIVDPIYVAALFADLQTFLQGLTGRNMGGATGGAGGVQSIAALATGTLVHCLNLHGDIYRPALPGATLVTQNADNTVTKPVPASGLVTLNGGDGIAAAAGDLGRLRWGLSPAGVLANTKLIPPTPASPLGRLFFQVMVVDTVWSLLGNRTATPVLGVGADDQAIPADVQPLVRDNVIINYLPDGPDVLGRASQVLARPSQSMVLAVSPVLDGTMSIPNQPGPAAHWPQFPPPNSSAGFPNPAPSPANGITAAFTAGNDVVVTIVADRAPAGAHIRIFPQSFVEIPAIAEEPSFVRADGGAANAQAGVATQILLPNPFNLVGAQPRPSPANLTMDIVVMPRAGQRKLWAAVVANVAAGPAAAPPNPFGGGNIVDAVPAMFESVAPVPLFGIPTTVTPPGAAPGGVIGFVRSLASETSPRQGPRLPTMARFDTEIVTGVTNPPGTTLLWEAVVSGGRWAPETRSALHADANPGNPAGPDVHASGIHVSGLLAYDVARHAIRRAQPILPFPGGTLGWLIALDGNNFNFPTDTNTAQTGVGVFLETVAAVTETPELSAFTPPPAGTTVASLLSPIAASLGLPAPGIAINNEGRLQREVRREYIVSSNGLRDALWSLRRAVHEARELIYIESPQFASTGTTDLAAEIASSMAAHPELRVIICTPRDADFSPKYRGWSRQHYRARSQAVGSLMAVDRERVVAFHPVGFPGRTAFIRSTAVIVDDVYSLVGATHWRRRGFTFDGSVAIASFDRQLDSGYSRGVRTFRRQLMAAKLRVPAPAAGVTPSGEWLRLARPASAFDLIQNWLADGGLGLIQPLWPGPSDTTVLPATDDMADPDGSNGATFVASFASLLAELGD